MINGSGRDRAGRTALALGPRHAPPAAHHLTGARAVVLRALIAAGDAVTVSALAERLAQHPNTVREHLDALVAGDRAERLRSEPLGRGRPAWLYRAVGPTSSANGSGGVGAGVFESGGEEYAALAVALIDQVVSASPDPRSMARQAGERWGRALVEQRERLRSGPGRAGGPSVGAGDRVRADPAGPAGADPAGAGPAGADPAGAGPAGADPAGAVIELLGELRYEPQPAADPAAVRLTACPLLDAARHNPDVVCEVHLGIVRGALDRLGGDPDGADLVAFAEPGACLLTLPGRR